MRSAQSSCGLVLSGLIILTLLILVLANGVVANAEEKGTHGIKEKVRRVR
jgi:hypothetical protein